MVSNVKNLDSKLMSQIILMNAVSKPKWLVKNTNGIDAILAGIDYRIRNVTSNVLELRKELNKQNAGETSKLSPNHISSGEDPMQSKKIEASVIISQISNKQRLVNILAKRKPNPQRISL